MTTLTETTHPGGFLVWEAFRDYTRETITVASGVGLLAAGTVLGKVTASGNYAAHDPAAVDGTETAVAVLWGKADASTADAPAVALVREVTGFGEGRIWSETTRLDLLVSEVPNPRPGDRIELGGEGFLIQGEPVRDRERLIWTVDLRPA